MSIICNVNPIPEQASNIADCFCLNGRVLPQALAGRTQSPENTRLLFPRLGLRWHEEARTSRSRSAEKLDARLSFFIVPKLTHHRRQRNGDEAMNKRAAQMAGRIQRAVKSGKLTVDGSYTIPTLVATIGTTRAQLRQAVNREFGSVASFCTHLGFGLMITEAVAAVQ